MTLNRLLAGGLAVALLSAGAQAQMPPKFDPTKPPGPGTSAAQIGGPQRAPSPPPIGADQQVFANDSAVDPATLQRAGQQLKGDYPALNRAFAGGSGLPLGMVQDAWSQPMKHLAPGQRAPGVVRFQWSPDLIMPLRIREGMTTAIMLPEWETIADVIKGEAQFVEWKKVRNNLIAVRSTQPGIDTTIAIVGKSGNAYTFYLRAESFNTKTLTDIMVYVEAGPSTVAANWNRASTGNEGFTVGDSPPSSPSASPGGHSESASPATPLARSSVSTAPMADADRPGGGRADDMLVPRSKALFNMNLYEVNPGDRSIAPDYVYSDGVWTYFHYAKDRIVATDMPVIYRVVDGVESRVNTRTAGQYGEVIIAEAVGDFVLRNGSKIVCAKQTKT